MDTLFATETETERERERERERETGIWEAARGNEIDG